MATMGISKGYKYVVSKMRSGKSEKGDWAFYIFEGADKITVFADNKDFKCEVGDTVKVDEINGISIRTTKSGDRYYTNYNVFATLSNEGENNIQSLDEDDTDDFTDNEADFI